MADVHPLAVVTTTPNGAHEVSKYEPPYTPERRTIRRPRTFGVDEAAKVILLGIASTIFLVWFFHGCKAILVEGSLSRQLGDSSDVDSGGRERSGLDILAEVCSSLPRLSVPVPVIKKASGAAVAKFQESRFESSDSAPSTSATRLPVDAVLSEASLANVPKIPSDIFLYITPWTLGTMRILNSGFMSCASQYARNVQKILKQTELSHSDIIILLQMSKLLPSYLVPLTFSGSSCRRPSYVAKRVGAALFAIDALFRVTQMFPTITNPHLWWNQLMSGLNLDFSYSVYNRNSEASMYVEDCRLALREYSQGKRPSPAELHRLFQLLDQKYSKCEHARRLKKKTRGVKAAGNQE